METSKGVRTEDVYETLQQPPVVKNSHSTHASWMDRKLHTLLIFNTLLMIIILIITGFLAATHLQRSGSEKLRNWEHDRHKQELVSIGVTKQEAVDRYESNRI
ncbi:uncharacterized protein LOC143516653 isoform X2 [Brachyhypopomus gauderio]|uniref:uncharacterized protein LOC143516653 isoform X2 n=1 Tax=Brachyhypopomus gauderio TaxID=698409 RepID=UPI0040420078